VPVVPGVLGGLDVCDCAGDYGGWFCEYGIVLFEFDQKPDRGGGVDADRDDFPGVYLFCKAVCPTNSHSSGGNQCTEFPDIYQFY